MTISSTTSRWVYNGDGSSLSFGYDNRIFAATDLKVYVDGQPVTTGFTVSGVDAAEGGAVTFAVPPPVGQNNVLIERDVPAVQLTRYPANDLFPSSAHERALDRLTVLIQQLQAQLRRTVGVARSSVYGGSLTLPEPSPGRVLKWNDDASGLTNSAFDPDVLAGGVATVLQAAEIAAQVVAGLTTFAHVDVGGQGAVSPAVAGDTLTLVAGTGVTLTTSPAARSVTIAAEGGGSSNLDQAVLQLYLINAVNGALAAGSFVNGAWDGFNAGSTLFSSVGATYDATGKYWSNPSLSGDMIPAATGTVVGNFTSNAALYDGNTRGTHLSGGSYSAPNGAVGKSGKAWPTAQTIGTVRIWDATNYNINAGGPGTVTVKVYGSNTGYDTGATLLATVSIANQVNAGYQDVAVVGAAAYLWTWVTFGEGQTITGYISLSEVQWFGVSVSSPDMTLVSQALTPAPLTAPSKVGLQIWWKPVNAATLNTDFIAEASRDDGATWSAGALSDSGIDPVSGFNLVKADISLTSQPTGTSLKYRLRTINSKSQQVKGVALAYQ